MKTELEARNSADTSDEKLMIVLEYFLSLHEADEIYDAIYDNQFEVEDVTQLLDKYKNNEE